MAVNAAKSAYTGWDPQTEGTSKKVAHEELCQRLQAENELWTICPDTNKNPGPMLLGPDEPYKYLGIWERADLKGASEWEALEKEATKRLNALVENKRLTDPQAQLAIEECINGKVRYSLGSGLITVKEANTISKKTAAALNKRGKYPKNMIHDSAYIQGNVGRGMRPAEEILLRESIVATRLTLVESAPRLRDLYGGIYRHIGRPKGYRDMAGSLPVGDKKSWSPTEKRLGVIAVDGWNMCGIEGPLLRERRKLPLAVLIEGKQWRQKRKPESERSTLITNRVLTPLWEAGVYHCRQLWTETNGVTRWYNEHEFRARTGGGKGARRAYRIVRHMAEGRRGTTMSSAWIKAPPRTTRGENAGIDSVIKIEDRWNTGKDNPEKGQTEERKTQRNSGIKGGRRRLILGESKDRLPEDPILERIRRAGGQKGRKAQKETEQEKEGSEDWEEPESVLPVQTPEERREVTRARPRSM
jgi:hypothetical protein